MSDKKKTAPVNLFPQEPEVGDWEAARDAFLAPGSPWAPSKADKKRGK